MPRGVVRGICATSHTDWFAVLEAISPFSFAYMGIGLGFGLSIIGAAW